MQSLSSRTGAGYRTALLTLPQAERFARCLQANARFSVTEIAESARTKSPEKRWFVVYQPASDTRHQALLTQAQDARAQRAAAEAGNYLFLLDDTQRFFWTVNVATGEVYETCRAHCSCPDFHYRCEQNGLRCKHQLALEAALSHGEAEAL